MIYIDARVGSKDLVTPLTKMGLPVEKVHLDFADIAFTGKGPKGRALQIGIELKKLSDLVGSLRTGRLSGHQLPGLLGPQGAYDYAWLLVEGHYQVDAAGRLLTFKGRNRGWRPIPGGMNATELEKRVLTLELCGGLHTRFTNSRPDTLRWLSALYHWWTDHAMDHHTSHLAAQTISSVVPLSDFRHAVCHWPGIGLRMSKAAEKAFHGSVTLAANATTMRWADITTLDDQGKSRRFGEKAAGKLTTFLHGGQ